MAKANKPATEKPGTKPATPRKAAAKASDANNQKEGGATAPVSLPVDQASAGDVSVTSIPPADAQTDAPSGQAGQAAPVFVRREFFPGMGRFPLDWKPAPRLEEPEPDGAELEQTTAETGSEEHLQSTSWGLPDIAEFPAELTLTNNTRNRVVVRQLNVHLPQFSSKTAICPTAEKYSAIQREYAGRAVREGWNSDKGLQVKHGEDQG
ncbi:hypothetical protein KVG88_29995 [Pseudomonas sp. SWRI74]|uniref:Uncharacterized protein n=1 Tax=Pseudomonas azerbaijanoccidentalis TaxID=2842347 RepID=A0ABS6R0C2_9PSED|nr:hypothetical protein [Pseudomonas azerbaijanoccidentalis]MBV4524307.1 hypothetical protein [Pseudomonas azerbaijanoccidentalis]